MGAANTLFILPSLRRGGAERQIVDLLNNLNRNRYRPVLYTYSAGDDLLDEIDPNGLKIYRDIKSGRWDRSIPKRLAQIIHNEQISIIHATIEYSILLAQRAKSIASSGAKLIGAIHTTQQWGVKNQIAERTFYKTALRRCQLVVFASLNQRERWIRTYPFLHRRSVVIHNGIDTDHYCPGSVPTPCKTDLFRNLQIPANAAVLSCVAGFRPEKRHDLLLQAFSGLSQSAYLLLLGDGPKKTQAMALSKALGLTSRVRFVGVVKDVRPYLAISRATVLASTAVETLSIATLESMAMAVPAIVTAIGGMGEIVVHEQCGWIVSPGNVPALREAMEQCITAANIGTIRANARERVVRQFNIDKMVTETERAFADIEAIP